MNDIRLSSDSKIYRIEPRYHETSLYRTYFARALAFCYIEVPLYGFCFVSTEYLPTYICKQRIRTASVRQIIPVVNTQLESCASSHDQLRTVSWTNLRKQPNPGWTLCFSSFFFVISKSLFSFKWGASVRNPIHSRNLNKNIFGK